MSERLVIKGVYKIMFIVFIISYILNIFYISEVNTLYGTYAPTSLGILLAISMIFIGIFIWKIITSDLKK